MTVAVALVPVESLDGIWPQVLPLLGPAVERSHGSITLASLASDLLESRAQLWVAADLESATPQMLAVCVTDVGIDPSGRKACDIRIATGHDRKRWLDCRREIETWARDEMGCSWIRMQARRGYARELPDYKMTHVILEKDLMADVGRQERNHDDLAEDKSGDNAVALRPGDPEAQHGPDAG